MALSLAGSPVLVATITQPGIGCWVADVEVATEAAPTGRVELVPDAGAAWSGTVIEGGVVAGTWRGRLVGGAGGLRAELGASSYRLATLDDVLADVAREAGEALEPGTTLAAWAARLYVRQGGRPAARTVADVARAAGLPWRVTRAGLLRVAAETWPALALADVSVVHEDGRARRYELAGLDVLSVDPGVTVTLPLAAGAASVRVDSVSHRVEGSDVTTTVWAHA